MMGKQKLPYVSERSGPEKQLFTGWEREPHGRKAAALAQMDSTRITHALRFAFYETYNAHHNKQEMRKQGRCKIRLRYSMTATDCFNLAVLNQRLVQAFSHPFF